MEWINIKDFDYPKELLADEFEKEIPVGWIIFAKKKNKHEIVVEKEFLSYRRYKQYDDIPKQVNHYIQRCRYKAIEHDDGTVTVFEIRPYAHFKDLVAYILVDDMLKELTKMQK